MSTFAQVTGTIKLNTSKLLELTQKQYEALAEAGDATLTEIKDRQLMPFNTGNLQNTSTTVDTSQAKSGRVSIVTTAPQARRLYFHPEYNFRRNNNANAGGKWFEQFDTTAFATDAYKRIFGRYLK